MFHYFSNNVCKCCKILNLFYFSMTLLKLIDFYDLIKEKNVASVDRYMYLKLYRLFFPCIIMAAKHLNDYIKKLPICCKVQFLVWLYEKDIRIIKFIFSYQESNDSFWISIPGCYIVSIKYRILNYFVKRKM